MERKRKVPFDSGERQLAAVESCDRNVPHVFQIELKRERAVLEHRHSVYPAHLVLHKLPHFLCAPPRRPRDARERESVLHAGARCCGRRAEAPPLVNSAVVAV